MRPLIVTGGVMLSFAAGIMVIGLTAKILFVLLILLSFVVAAWLFLLSTQERNAIRAILSI